MEVLDILWFTNMFGCVGIARTDDEYNGIRYYISYVPGLNVDEDTERVAQYGSTFPKDAGDALFGIKGE
jgi:hypothetical protein